MPWRRGFPPALECRSMYSWGPCPGKSRLGPFPLSYPGQRYRPAWEHDRFPALSGHFQRYAKPWFSVCRPTTEMGQFPGVPGPGFIITQRPLGRLPSRLLSLMVRPSAPWPTLELRGRIKYGGAYSTAMYPNSMARCRAIKASRASSNRLRHKPSSSISAAPAAPSACLASANAKATPIYCARNFATATAKVSMRSEVIGGTCLWMTSLLVIRIACSVSRRKRWFLESTSSMSISYSASNARRTTPSDSN